MYEQSDTYRLREKIMDHTTVQSMDAHERHDLAEKTKGMTHPELRAALENLDR